jgi:hypothetical protein
MQAGNCEQTKNTGDDSANRAPRKLFISDGGRRKSSTRDFHCAEVADAILADDQDLYAFEIIAALRRMPGRHTRLPFRTSDPPGLSLQVVLVRLGCCEAGFDSMRIGFQI